MAFTVKKYNLEKTKDLLSYIKEDLDSDAFKEVKSKISQLEKENTEKNKLIAELKEELAKERECVEFYGNINNYYFSQEYKFEEVWSKIGHDQDFSDEVNGNGAPLSFGGKRARQRIKERKEF